jgi:predicted Rossmann fold flavoprotein
VSVEKAAVTICGMTQTGPLLITHFGFSGPCVLKLSAWKAIELYALHYKTAFFINWLPDMSQQQLVDALKSFRIANPAKQVASSSPFVLPKNLWKQLVQVAGELKYNALSNELLLTIAEKLHNDAYEMEGKTTYKQEFVTCGGIKLSEVNFKTMESKLVPGLYFAGEVLNIDGITGGFNFQNAWTTSWIASQAIAEQ